MGYFVFDRETTTKTSFKRKANMFDPDNWVVANGFKHQGGKSVVHYFESPEQYQKLPINDATLLVGFNIKFDLQWHWDEFEEFFARGGRIWDCQYAEYLINGQSHESQMCSMDSVVEQYGGELKVDEVKALWNSGVDTPDIPEDLLTKYLHGDVNNTEIIFLGQLEKARKQNQVEMIMSRMDGLLCTTDMEYNGLVIDRELGERQRENLYQSLTKLDTELKEYIPELPTGLDFNWNSVYHKSYLIYGGTAKYQKWVQHEDEDGNKLYSQKKVPALLRDGKPWLKKNGEHLTEEFLNEVCTKMDGIKEGYGNFVRDAIYKAADKYKSGKNAGKLKTKIIHMDDLDKPKGSKKTFYFTFDGYTKPKNSWESTLKDAKGNNIFGTGADIIKELGNRDIPFLKGLANRAKIDKDLGTYYWGEDSHGRRKGMLTLVQDDGKLHHKLNHTTTVTTRLSSSDPNMQNVPRGDKSDVKKLFVSRFGDDGYMMEADYSQLEVIIQAWFTGDKQMKQDVRDGVDFHCKRLSAKLGEDYNDVVRKAKNEEDPDYDEYSLLRTLVKGFTFQRALTNRSAL